MTGCMTCGGYGNRHDDIAHDLVGDDACTCVPHPYGSGPEEDCLVHGIEELAAVHAYDPPPADDDWKSVGRAAGDYPG